LATAAALRPEPARALEHHGVPEPDVDAVEPVEDLGEAQLTGVATSSEMLSGT
jgi:uncharacterized protein YpuA (DUF1002 family)